MVQTVTGPEARANIDSLAQKYLDADYPEELIHSERVMVRHSNQAALGCYANLGYDDVTVLSRRLSESPQ